MESAIEESLGLHIDLFYTRYITCRQADGWMAEQLTFSTGSISVQAIITLLRATKMNCI